MLLVTCVIVFNAPLLKCLTSATVNHLLETLMFIQLVYEEKIFLFSAYTFFKYILHKIVSTNLSKQLTVILM